MADLITPVEYAKQIGVPPQQIYGMIKRGLPTKQAEHKGKMRDMIDSEDANKWRAVYATTKRQRRSSSSEEGDDSPRDDKPEYRPMFKGGELVMHARGKKNFSVSRIKQPDEEHLVYLQRNMYTFPFLLNPTQEEEWFMNPQHLKRKILNRDIIMDTPFQVLEYCLAQIEVARPELAIEIREVIEKHLAETKENVDVAERTSYNYNRR